MISLITLIIDDFSQIKELKNAIENDYFFEMFIDDLPMWGYLGEVSTARTPVLCVLLTREINNQNLLRI